MATSGRIPAGTDVQIRFADWIGLDPFEEQDTWRFVWMLAVVGAVFALPGLLLSIPGGAGAG